jgi:hypothetical protein
MGDRTRRLCEVGYFFLSVNLSTSIDCVEGPFAGGVCVERMVGVVNFEEFNCNCLDSLKV